MTDVPTTHLTNTDLAPAATTITTGASPYVADPAVRCYEVTSGGTAGVENITLPMFALNGAGINAPMIGQRAIFYLKTQTDPSDSVNVAIQGRATIPIYLTDSGHPGARSISGSVVLDYEGAIAAFVWVGYTWALDRGITGDADDGIPLSQDYNLRIPDAIGAFTGGNVIIQGGNGTGTGGGGHVELTPGTTVSGSPGQILATVPTADPHIPNALWSNSGVLTVSAG